MLRKRIKKVYCKKVLLYVEIEIRWIIKLIFIYVNYVWMKIWWMFICML